MIQAAEQAATEATPEQIVRHMCGMFRGQQFDQQAFEELTGEQQQKVTQALEGRGLVLYPRDGSVHVMAADVAVALTEFFAMAPEYYDFAVNAMDDPRIACSGDVYFRVANCRSKHEAWSKLCRFMVEFQTVALDLGPLDDGESEGE